MWKIKNDLQMDFMILHNIVCPPPPPIPLSDPFLLGEGLNLQPNFQKKGAGLDRTLTFRGGCWEGGGNFQPGEGCNLKYLMAKKVYKEKYFSLS